MPLTAEKKTENPGNSILKKGKKIKTLNACRCLAALAEWERLSVLCAREWRRQEALVRRDMAAIAAHAAWHMGDWDSMSTYTATLKDTQESPAARLNGEFLSGVLRAHLQDWEGALSALPSPPLSLSPSLSLSLSLSLWLTFPPSFPHQEGGRESFYPFCCPPPPPPPRFCPAYLTMRSSPLCPPPPSSTCET